MTKALITGIGGFAGSHLADFLLSAGYQVSGIDCNLGNAENTKHIRDRLTLYDCDIRNGAQLNEIISQNKPDEVYHLVAIAYVPIANANPKLTFDVNFYGSFNLFEAVKRLSEDTKVLYVGSATEYGNVRQEGIPVNEDVPLNPVDPYSASKACADMLAYQYFKSYGLPIVRVRPFNHIGPRQSADYVCANFAKQIAEIEKGVRKPVINVGNLKPRRDFIDVRDVVRAYWLALQKGEPGEVYNICSGKAISIKELLDKLLSMSKKNIEVKQDPEKLRPSDIPLLLGDCARFGEKTDWEPEIPFEKTLKELLDYWRERIQLDIC